MRELWFHRDLLLSFAARDLKARYKQTIMGAAWAVLQPALLMLAFTLVFARFVKVPTEGVPYPIFAYTGLIFWTCFSTTLSQGTVAIVANSPLVRKIYFPRETLLLAVVISNLFDLLVATGLLAVMLAYYHVGIGLAVLWIPVLLALQTLLSFAIICITSAVHVNFRDVGHAIPLLLQIWLFASPVAYPLSLVPESLLSIYVLNPMAPIIDGYRLALLQNQSPDLTHLAGSAVVTLLLLVLGYAVFQRAQQTFADVV